MSAGSPAYIVACISTEVIITDILRMSSFFFFFSSRRRHTRYWRDWSSDVCSSDLGPVDRGDHRLGEGTQAEHQARHVLLVGEPVARLVAAVVAGRTAVAGEVQAGDRKSVV